MHEKVRWDHQSDVLVVGLGAAGAAAAITAKDSGVDVLVVEKTATGGGNSALSYNIMNPERKQEAIRYIQALKLREYAGLPIPKLELKLINTFVKEAMKNLPWIRSLGGEYEPSHSTGGYPAHPIAAGFNLPGSEAIRQYRISGETVGGGASLLKLLFENLKARKIRIFFRTRAQLLIRTKRGVEGLVATKGGRRLYLRSRRGIILACGGYEFSEDLISTFIPVKPFYAIGARSNTGDGVRMGQAVGAKIWHMHCIIGYPGFKSSKDKFGYPIRMHTTAFFYVDKYGKRFTNETAIEAHLSWWPLVHFDPIKLEYPRIPSYVIFDEQNFRAAPLCLEKAIHGLWSMDNLEELKKGWILTANTIEQLAKNLRLNPKPLCETFDRYNQLCRTGYDTDFGRTKEELLPLDNPPFYGIELWPTLLNTQGGPVRNERCQILDTEGKPIPRLYSAGELGSLWGNVYQSSGNIAECLATGRIAGRNAAAEKTL